jgi:hypothetical protein
MFPDMARVFGGMARMLPYTAASLPRTRLMVPNMAFPLRPRHPSHRPDAGPKLLGPSARHRQGRPRRLERSLEHHCHVNVGRKEENSKPHSAPDGACAPSAKFQLSRSAQQSLGAQEKYSGRGTIPRPARGKRDCYSNAFALLCGPSRLRVFAVRFWEFFSTLALSG